MLRKVKNTYLNYDRQKKEADPIHTKKCTDPLLLFAHLFLWLGCVFLFRIRDPSLAKCQGSSECVTHVSEGSCFKATHQSNLMSQICGPVLTPESGIWTSVFSTLASYLTRWPGHTVLFRVSRSPERNRIIAQQRGGETSRVLHQIHFHSTAAVLLRCVCAYISIPF